MKRTILIYSLGLAAGAFLLQWLDYMYSVRSLSREIYIVVIAVGFASLGIWVCNRLTAKHTYDAFEKNERAIAHLGISDREYEVLLLLAEGLSNREIASKLFLSGNTVKSHVASLYSKLEASRRTQAVQKARSLGIIA